MGGVAVFESLVDVPALLVDRPPIRPSGGCGKRVAVATTTGGGAAMGVDNMAMAGLDIADPPQAMVNWLKPLSIAAGEGKLVDLALAGVKRTFRAGGQRARVGALPAPITRHAGRLAVA